MPDRKAENCISDKIRPGLRRTGRLFAVLLAAMLFALTVGGCGEISLDPDDSGAYDEGIRAIENAEYETASAKLKEAAEVDGRLAESYRAQGIAYFDKGDYKHAEEMFALSLDSMRVVNEEFKEDVNYYRAECFSRMGETTEAQILYEELENGSKPYLAYAMLGKIFMEQGLEQKARLYFDMAVEDNPDYAVFLVIYDACREALLEADGTAYLEKALALEPKDARDHANLGRVCECLEDYDNAILNLQLAVDDGYTPAVCILADIYLEQGNVAAARELYEKEIRNGSDPANGYNGLALCELAQGKADTALQFIQEGLKCENDTMKKSLLFNEVLAYETMRDFDTALRKANEFLLLYPNDEKMKQEKKFLSS